MSHTGRPEFRLNCLSVHGSFSKTRSFMTSGGGDFSLCADDRSRLLKPGADGSGDTGCRPRYTRCT